jgi:aspartyl-tRNA(Asn)/glutamyl-tRNA(Gln) amidotransferase subunit B
MRSKEEAFDYRYFPEPDLVPLAPSPAWIASVSASLPLLPAARRARVASAAGLPAGDDAVATVVRLDLDSFVMAAADVGADAALAVRRLANEVASFAGLAGGRPLDPDGFCRLLLMESRGELTTAQARSVLGHMLASGGDPVAISSSLGFAAMDAGALGEAVDAVIGGNSAEWGRYLAGEDKLQGFFVGKVRAATGGNADLKAVSALLRSRRAAAGA